MSRVKNQPMMAEITYAIQDAEAENPGMWGDDGVYGIAVSYKPGKLIDGGRYTYCTSMIFFFFCVVLLT